MRPGLVGLLSAVEAFGMVDAGAVGGHSTIRPPLQLACAWLLKVVVGIVTAPWFVEMRIAQTMAGRP